MEIIINIILEGLVHLLIYLFAPIYAQFKILELNFFKKHIKDNKVANVILRILMFIFISIIIFILPGILIALTIISDESIFNTICLIIILVYFIVLLIYSNKIRKEEKNSSDVINEENDI